STSLVELTKTTEAFEGVFSGELALNTEKNFAQIISKTKLNLPRNGAQVFLEIDFNSDINFEVLLQSNNIDGAIFTDFVLGLNPTNGEWKKLYLELAKPVSSNTLAQTYQLIFKAELPSSKTQGFVHFD